MPSLKDILGKGKKVEDGVYKDSKMSMLKELQKAAAGYFSGSFTDAQFIAERARHQHSTVRKQTNQVFMAQGVSYGDSAQTFIDALEPTAEERQALDYILGKVTEPVIIAEKSPSKVFELFWTPHGKDFIRSIVTDPQYAAALCNMHDSPSTILKLAFEWQTHQDTLNALPKYTALPALAAFADAIARLAKTQGTEKAIRELKKRPDTPHGKSLEYAFLLAFQAEKEAKWKFTTEEINYGEFLKPSVDRLINAPVEDYTTALQSLLSACGSTETITEQND